MHAKPLNNRPTIRVGALCALALSATLLLPASASAQSSGADVTLASGIFDCRGGNFANPGSLSAIGSLYVPVHDVAITLNTGYLTYKDCVLDVMTNKLGQAATSQLADSTLRTVLTGRNGEALFAINKVSELQVGHYAVGVARLDISNTGVLCPAFTNRVRTAVARNIIASHEQTNEIYRCTFPGTAAEYNALVEGRGPFSWEAFLALSRPENNPLGAYFLVQEDVGRNQALYEQNQREEWLANGGFYSVTDNAANPLAANILTPGSLVREGAIQAFTAGFRQLENADELGELTGSLWGGLMDEAISGAGGLTGLLRSSAGLPSYLDRMVEETTSAARTGVVNTALSVLRQAIDIETTYKRAKEQVAQTLASAITRLRTAESTCWNLIIPKVQDYARTVNCPQSGSCASVPPVPLTIATSTQFSQAVISAQIAPAATTTAADVAESEEALTQLQALVAAVTVNQSGETQRAAIEALDLLIVNDQIHTTDDAQRALNLADDAVVTFDNLYTDTVEEWGDDTNPLIGWCNINNPAVIQRWFNAWRASGSSS